MGRNVPYVEEDYIRGHFYCSPFELSLWRIVQDCFFNFLFGITFKVGNEKYVETGLITSHDHHSGSGRS